MQLKRLPQIAWGLLAMSILMLTASNSSVFANSSHPSNGFIFTDSRSTPKKQVQQIACSGNSGIDLPVALINGGFEEPDIAAQSHHPANLVPGWSTTEPQQTIEIWDDGFNGVNAYAGNQFGEVNSHAFATLYQDIDTTPGATMEWSFAHRGRAGDDTVRLLIGPPESAGVPQGDFTTGTSGWQVYSGTYIVPDGQTITRFSYEAVAAAGGLSVGNFLDGIEFSATVCPDIECSTTDIDIDTDNDGILDSIDLDNDNDGILDFVEGMLQEDTDGDSIPNMCDLDSDNDGINDLVESGTSDNNVAADVNRDGTISVAEAMAANRGVPDRDVDGLMDIFDADDRDVDAGPSAGTTPVNSDGVDEEDFLDLDSDNDGIPDAVEAQLTAGYATTFSTDGDVTDDDGDGDGVISIYDAPEGAFGGTFNDPVNTDNDDVPDYLDTNSDNDGFADAEEHGLGPENGGPANPTYPDPNGRIDDPPTTLQNESGDNTEVAYRELWVPPTIDPDDKDGDGIPNATDIDDDNDGIIDREENIIMDSVAPVVERGRTNGMSSDLHLRAHATNSCPADQVAVALYGGSVTRGMVGADSVDSLNNGICVQVVPANDWATMTVAEFQTFDVLWIGNDDFTAVGGAAAFNQAVASRPVWEAAIDPGNLMVAGGDYDFHVYRNGGGDARAITEAMIKESADGSAPGLVLMAGAYSITGNPWYQNLGGTFEGLFHAGVGSQNPGPTDVTSHEFNTKYGWTAASYAFHQSCHGGIYIVPGSPVEQYNLQVMFYYPGGVVPCFMMSDTRFPPFFPTRDTDNDGIPDACDLDSDNDGISDLIESGASADLVAADINRDGSVSPSEVLASFGINPDADGDGLMDIFDADITNPTSDLSVGTLPINSDTDNRHNYIDLDSDSDGIPDVIEGKPTRNFGPTYGNDGDVRDDDIDTDGAISVFDNNDLTTGNFGGTFPLPEDTDEDGTPDYLDLDSDNDFALDEWESGLILSGLDNFADGLDDLVNPSEDYRDNNGIVDLPWRDLEDEDDNAETDGDVDYREFNPEFDRGDAPARYGDASNSISEFIDIWMGSPDELPDEDDVPVALGNNAQLDDLVGADTIDDEEAVRWFGTEDPTFDTGLAFYPSKSYTYTVEVYNNSYDVGFLKVWIDYNGNGQFDPNEREENQLVPRGENSQTLSLGFTVPEEAACGRTFARFRFSNEETNSPTGYTGWGETEDYAITIDCRTDLEPLLEFSPDSSADPDLRPIRFITATRTYEGDWELSHDIAITATVRNNGPQIARTITMTVQLPVEMTNVNTIALPNWTCDVDASSMLATCFTFNLGLAVDAESDVMVFTGRIPGTFLPNAAIGYASVEHSEGDHVPENDRVDYNILVFKKWQGVEDVEPFIYVRFSESIDSTATEPIERDLAVGDRLVIPIQVPVSYAAGVEPISEPFLTTRWCLENAGYPGCDLASDIITGTIAVESHTTMTITAKTPNSSLVAPVFSNTNLVSTPVTRDAARDGSNLPDVRYAPVPSGPDPYASCQEWISSLSGGQCTARLEVINGMGLSDANRAIFEWDEIDLTPIVFQTTGGRAIGCDDDEGQCIYIRNARPTIHLVEGSVDYQVVFNDPLGRIPLTREDREHPISYFIQLIAPFVEPEK